MPTGLKIFLLMTAALLPLGVIALLASLQASRTADSVRRADLRVAVTEATRKLAFEFGSDLAVGRAATEAVAMPEDARVACFRIDMVFSARRALQPRYALFGPDRAIACATPGFAPPPPPMQSLDAEPRLIFADDAISFELIDPGGRGAIILRYPAKALGDFVRPIGLAGTAMITLADAAHELRLRRSDIGYLSRLDTASAPIGLMGLSLTMSTEQAPFSAAEALQAFLPLLMWASAAIVAFLVTDRLLIRPLLRLRTAVARMRPGERLVMPDIRTPAREIRELADTFDAAGDTIATHEAQLAQALSDQVKLTREVHHRVKNNLQVVASLISLHARGAPPGPVADAYASIQRRVDALAVVHRNHYAELEENHGVSAKSLIGELAANLRTGIAASGTPPAITIRAAPVRVSQDVAVPVAFLITELVELSISRVPDATITIALPEPAEGLAELVIESAAFQTADGPDLPRGSRIVEGLARQLRAPLRIDPAAGVYAIAIPVLDTAEGRPKPGADAA